MIQQSHQPPQQAQIEALQNHLKHKPDDGQGWLFLARLLSRKPPGDQLRHAISQCIRLLPDNYGVWLMAAQMQQHEHGLAAVLQWLDRTEQQNTGLTSIKLASATMRASVDPNGAYSRYKDVISTSPGDTHALMLLARLQQRQGKLEEAALSLEQALQIKPDTAQYWGHLAEIRNQQLQWKLAVTAATRAIELDRKLLAAWSIRAEALMKSCLWQQALSDFEEVRKHRAQDPQLLNRIGLCLIRLNQFDRAAEHFKMALEADPEFTVAKLNIGLLHATQLNPDEAVSIIKEALQDPVLDATSRQTANITLDLLAEQKRLQPLLDQALGTGDLVDLQSALDNTPSNLLQTDKPSVDKLRKLASLCRNLQFNPEDFKYTADTEHLSFLEACALCKIPADTNIIEVLYSELNKHSGAADLSQQKQDILLAWHIIRDRQKISADVLKEGQGEACLRYWQARLLEKSPETQPGQFKAIMNTIGREIPTPPECVVGSYRFLLNELRSTLPAGLPRAVFMYIAINMIHGFCDGNGRLGRFLLAWETEATGLPAIVIPLELQQDLASSLVKALFEDELESLVNVLIKAHVQTDRLLQELNASPASKR